MRVFKNNTEDTMLRRWIGVTTLFLTVVMLVGCKNGGDKPNGNPVDSTTVNTQSNLSSTNTNDTTAGAIDAAITPNSPLPTQGLRIAWVSMDTILKGYDYYFAMEREMAELTAKAEQDLNQKGKALESKVAAFQDNMQKGLLTRTEAQNQQEALAAEQTRFLQLQETKRMQLQEEEAVRLRRVQNAISNYLNRFNAEHGYNYILSVGVLYGDPRLSVTQEVLQGLNKEYAEQHAAATKNTMETKK